MATYVNDLRLKEIGTGESSGTWGTETNVNLELIGEALSFGTESITTNADTHTSTVADGSTDPARSIYIKYTGTLDSACTITIAPNTLSRLHFIENGTSGSQNIIISQGSGANVTIPPGDVKVVYLDGAGSGAAVVDAFASLNVVDLKVEDDLTVTDDATIGGTLGVTGVLTANAGVVVDNITIDGTEIDLSSGDLTLDVAGDIILDAGGSDILLKEGGTQFGRIGKGGGSDLIIDASIADKDIFLTGTDGSSAITALLLDMSAAGKATFNAGADFSSTVQVTDATFDVHSSSAGAVIGKIGNTANDLNIFSSTSGHNGLRFHVNGILPTDNSGTIIDNDADLGDPSYRFKDINMAGSVKGAASVLIGNTDGTDPLVVVDSAADSITARFKNTNADALPAILTIEKDSASPADDDFVGQIQFAGSNDNNQQPTFVDILVQATDVSDGAEDGNIVFKTSSDGSLTQKFKITEGGAIIQNGTTANVQTVPAGSMVSFCTGQFVCPSSGDGVSTQTLFNLPESASTGTGQVFVSCENSGQNVSFGYILNFHLSNNTFTVTAVETGNSQGTTSVALSKSSAAIQLAVTYAGGLGGNIQANAGGHVVVTNV